MRAGTFQGRGLGLLRFSSFLILAISVFASVSSGQNLEEKENWKLERGSKEWALEFGYAPMQPTFFSGRKEYDTDGRKLALGSFRWGRVIGTVKGVTYEYLFEAMPIAVAIRNEVANPSDSPEDDKLKRSTHTLRQNTYGAAINPAGFRFVFLPKRRLKPFVQMSAGFIFTKKPIPIPASPSYNFSGDFGGGLMYSLDKQRTINFGYRYFHISNMNIGEINPGYNANIFYVGFSSFYK